MPHALARHNPGDRPTHNVRTAPTPTTEEPPVGHGVPQVSQVGQDSKVQHGQIPGGQLYAANQEVRI